LGIESSKNGELNLTYGMPVTVTVTVTDPTTKFYSEILDTTSSLLRIGRDKLRLQSSKTLEAGKIQYMVFSKEIAEKVPIGSINEVFERDPSNPVLAWVAVVDCSPRELIHTSVKYIDKPRPSIYITHLMERAAECGYTPETRVYNFNIINFAPGIDNITPLIAFDSKAVEVKGSALFSSGKMVGTINPRQTGLLISMMKTLKNKRYTYIASDLTEDTTTPKKGLAILLRQNSKKIYISIQDNNPKVDIYLNLYGYIDEYKWDNLRDKNRVKQLSSLVQQQIQEDCQKLIEYMQSIESDPIGIGDMVRAKYNSYFKGVVWHNEYKKAIITTHVKFNIIQYGDIQ